VSYSSSSTPSHPVPHELEGPGAAVGSVVGGYTLEEYLGCGAMADVYAGSSATGPVAVKRLLPMRRDSHHLVDLFLHEARVLLQISHPNVARCIDFGLSDGVPYLVTSYVDGVSCELLLAGLAGERGAFPVEVALAIVHQVLLGLSAVHEARDPDGRLLGIVHQDVSPDNVLIGRNGSVTLIDFGVARSHNQRRAGGAEDLRGKLGYMSPEQILGERIDARSDVFSVGALLGELLLGKRLFGAPTTLGSLVRASRADTDDLGDLDPRVSADVREVLARALERRPARRFPSARAFDRAVGALQQARGAPLDAAQMAAWLAARGVAATGAPRSSRSPTPAVGNLVARIDAADRVLVDGRGGEPSVAAPRRPTPSSAPTARLFRVREPGSHTELPCSLADLVERFATGRVSDATLAASGRSAPVALVDVPELVHLARASKARFDAELGRAPRWRCSLERARLPGMLFMLAGTRATGLLSARAGARRKLVYFDAGVPCFVASSEPSELIGAQLLAGGFLSRAALDDAVAGATVQQRPLGETLAEMRVLSSSEMLRQLVTQLDTRVLELGSWLDANLSFTPGLRPGAVIPQSLGVPGELACRMVRTRYCDEEISDFLRPLADASLTAKSERPRVEQPLPLLEVETGVLSAAASCRDIGTLTLRMTRDHALPPEDTRRAVFMGLSAGLLESPAWLSPFATSGLGSHR